MPLPRGRKELPTPATALLVLIVLLMLAVTASPAAAGTTIISGSSSNNWDPQISDGRVVWRGWDGSANSIFLYDGGSVTNLRQSSSVGDYAPQISGDQIVWEGSDGSDLEIFFYDGVSVTRLTDNDTMDERPQVSGGQVVWQGSDGSDSEIFLYDGQSVINLSDNTTDDLSPQISDGQVVWYGWEGAGWEVYLYDGTSTRLLSDTSADNSSPQISNGRVVWTGHDGNDYEIFLYDGTTTRQVSDNTTPDFLAQISDQGQVVWNNLDGSDYEIYLYDGATVTQLTDNDVTDTEVQISGSDVVWKSYNGSNWEIHRYDGTTTAVFADPGVDYYYPQISGGEIVAMGLAGSARNIFLYAPPAVSLPGDETLTESDTFTATGSVSNLGGDSATATVDYGDGAGPEALTLIGATFDLSHTYLDDGVYTVTVTVEDEAGATGSASLTVTVDNAAPIVSLPAGPTITEGETFAATGSFLDVAGDAPFTATVDYGEGEGQEGLTLSGSSFDLSHTYAEAGSFTVTVRVTDKDGGMGSQTLAVTVEDAPLPSYLDVPETHPFYEAITELSSREIITGYSDETFRPQEAVMRAQYAKMIVNALGITVAEEMTSPFEDMGEDTATDLYPHEYVSAAWQNGITIGTTASTFSPWREISRAQVLTMVIRAVEDTNPALLDTPPASYENTWGNGFSKDHAANARTAEYNGLLDGLDLTTDANDPWAPMPRGEVAQVLYNMLRLIEG